MKSLILICALLSAVPLFGATITFIPPNDPVGAVFTTNSNDGYAGMRGLVFQMAGDAIIDSVGILQDLTGITLDWSVSQTTGFSGNVGSGKTVLRSGSAVATTDGLEWIDFSFAPLILGNGNSYLIEFSFTGSSNQNFYYANVNMAWAQGSYTQLDGTSAGDTINTVVPAIRLDEVASVPEPSACAMLAGGLGLLLLRRRPNAR